MSDEEDRSESGSAMDDTPADGARRSGENPYVEDEYRRRTQQHPGGWYKPFNLSDEFVTVFSTEGIDLESCLKGSELASMFKAYNAYEEKHGKHYVKSGRRNIPPGMIDYLLQTSGKFAGGEKTYLMIAQGNKVTIRQTKGQDMHIVTPFGVEDNQIFFPKGLVWSRASIKDEKKLPFNIKTITPLQGNDFPAIDMFKEIASRTARPRYELTEDEYKKVFCLNARFRGTQGSYSSKYNFELYSFCSRPADNAADDNKKYLITNGWFSDEKRQLTELLLKDRNHFRVDIKNTYDFKSMYEAVHKPKTTTRKRKAQDDSGATEFEVQADEDNRYLDIDVDARNFVSWNTVIKNMVNEQRNRITPKSEGEFWKALLEYYPDWSNDKREEIKAAFEDEVQKLTADKEFKKTAEDARECVLTGFMTKHLVTPARLQVNYAESEHPMTLAVQADEGACNATIEIVRQMVCAALVITVKNSGVRITKATPDMKAIYFDSGFMRPYYEAGILAESVDSEVISNIIRLENAMNLVIGAVGMREDGRDIAMHISILQENLGIVVDNLMETEYQTTRKWVSSIIECTLSTDEDEEQFDKVWLPSILSAMVLFFIRKMCNMVLQNRWNEIPSNISCRVSIPAWKIPSKRDRLAKLHDHLRCSWDDWVQLPGNKEKFVVEDESINADDMITSRNRLVLLKSKNQEKPFVTIRHIVKILTADGKFKLDVVNYSFKFSPYDIFSECDKSNNIFQQLGNVKAVEEHNHVHSLHTVITKIFNESLGQRKQFAQVPIKSSYPGDPTEWIQIKDDCFNTVDRGTIIPLRNKTSILIDSVLKDLAISMNLIINDALRDTGFVEWNLVAPTEITNRCRRSLSNGVKNEFLMASCKGFVKMFLINIGKASFAAQDQGVTLIGQSIVNDDIRGMVYVLSLDTMDLIKSGVSDELKNMTQPAVLASTFYIPTNLQGEEGDVVRDPKTCNEEFFIHPDIFGAEKMEPMNAVAASAIKEHQEGRRVND